MSKLRDEFYSESGITWENSQGEPDIDYVLWLEKKMEKLLSGNTSDIEPLDTEEITQSRELSMCRTCNLLFNCDNAEEDMLYCPGHIDIT